MAWGNYLQNIEGFTYISNYTFVAVAINNNSLNNPTNETTLNSETER